MFLAPDGALRPDVDLLDDRGGGATERLKMAIDSIEAMPFDDSIAESPHAIGNAIGRHARGSTFTWIASTMRLEQNLRDIHDWSNALGVDIEQEWLTYTSLLQTSPRKYGRPMRIKPASFRDRMYHMGLFSKGLRTANDDGDDGKQPMPLPMDDDHPEGGDGAVAGAAVAMAERPSHHARHALQQLTLMKEFMELCLKPGTFVSVLAGDDSDQDWTFLQVLAIEPKVTTVVTCFEKDTDRPRLKVAVQEFTPTFPVSPDRASLLVQAVVDVFAFSDEHPSVFDFGKWAPCDRQNIIEWSTGESSAHGCVSLMNPRTLMPDPTLSLMSPNIPTLCLLDALAELHWTGRPGIAVHTPCAEKVFDNRQPVSKTNICDALLFLMT